MIIKTKKRDLSERIFQGVLWMLPAIILIALVLMRVLDARVAIALVIAYHFICFWGIISFGKYSKKKK